MNTVQSSFSGALARGASTSIMHPSVYSTYLPFSDRTAATFRLQSQRPSTNIQHVCYAPACLLHGILDSAMSQPYAGYLRMAGTLGRGIPKLKQHIFRPSEYGLCQIGQLELPYTVGDFACASATSERT